MDAGIKLIADHPECYDVLISLRESAESSPGFVAKIFNKITKQPVFFARLVQCGTYDDIQEGFHD